MGRKPGRLRATSTTNIPSGPVVRGGGAGVVRQNAALLGLVVSFTNRARRLGRPVRHMTGGEELYFRRLNGYWHLLLVDFTGRFRINSGIFRSGALGERAAASVSVFKKRRLRAEPLPDDSAAH